VKLGLPLVVAFVLTLTPRPLLSQTTGRLAGEAVDEPGRAVPGVLVTMHSRSLQGSRSATTDTRGAFQVGLLPPGTYDVRADRTGFKTVQISGVRVELDRTATVRIRLELAAFRETVDVTGASSAIDVTSHATGLNATAELYTRIPLDRSYLSVVRVPAGAQKDEVGPALYGSTGAENQYLVDGLNVTGTVWGTPVLELNLDFVDEIEVKTGGLTAEYGRTTGGIVNVITKSGGNDFHGSAFGFFAGGGLQSDDRTAALRPADTTTVLDTSSRYDFGAELGGRIVRDRLWFFAAFNRVAEDTDTTVIRDLEVPGAPGVGSVIPTEARDNRFAGKLTWRPSASHTLAFSVFGDPRSTVGVVKDIHGPPSTYSGTIEREGANATIRYEGTFANSLLLRALLGRHRLESHTGGPGTETARLNDLTVIPATSTGGLGFYEDRAAPRDVAKLDVSKVVGRHKLGVGGDIEVLRGELEIFESGGDRVTKLIQDDQVFYNHFLLLDDRAPGFQPQDPATWQPVPSFPAAYRSRNLSGYAQDAWRVGRGVTANLGLRFEAQDLEDRDGTVALSVDNWAPRLGVTWDVGEKGRAKLYAGFSRYFESIPQFIQPAAFAGFTYVGSNNFDPTPGSIAPHPEAPPPFAYGGASTPVSSGIKGQFVDEWLVGFERELDRDFVVGAKGAWRRLGRVIDDLTAGNGEYFFGNPGEGPASTLGFIDGSSAPSPKGRRDNYSLELTARRRLSRGWQLLASYVFTRLEGNYDGTYQRSTGSLGPNWNSDFDWADFMVNADGRLTSESVHQWKLDASYELSGRARGLNLGLSTHWYSGLPLNAYGFSLSYVDWVYHLAPRGSVGRNPADFEVDLHIGYPIRLGKKARLLVLADVFNLLDRQSPVIYDQRYNLASDGPCAGIPEGLCQEDGGLATRPGTLEPLGSIPDPRGSARNPDYIEGAKTFTRPRSVRIGLRLSF
jgi:Carboxypeptidase regulatory-like domain